MIVFLCYLQVFVASRLNVPGAWQMPQVIPHSDLIFLKQQLIHEKCAGIVQLLIISVLALERVLYYSSVNRRIKLLFQFLYSVKQT